METIEVETTNQTNQDGDESNILKDEELKEYYQSIFSTCDTNNDGVISVTELKNFIEKNEKLELSVEVITTIYNKYDKNMDEQMDFEEFVEMVNSKKFKTIFRNISDRMMRFIVQHAGGKMKLSRMKTATGTYEEEIQFRKIAVGIILISILQVIIHYAKSDKMYEALQFSMCKRYQVHRYLTFLLLHVNEAHLYGNVILQLLLGIPLELVHTWRIPLLYFVAGVGGALFHSVIQRVDLVGGSPGAYSFFAVHIAAVIMNWREMRHPAVRVILFAIIFVIDFLCKNLIISMGTSYWSHFGGIAVGLFLGVNILRNLKVTQLEKIIWYICFIALGITIFTLIVVDFYMTIPDCI